MQATLPTLVVNKSCVYILLIRFKRLQLQPLFVDGFHVLISLVIVEESVFVRAKETQL